MFTFNHKRLAKISNGLRIYVVSRKLGLQCFCLRFTNEVTQNMKFEPNTKYLTFIFTYQAAQSTQAGRT